MDCQPSMGLVSSGATLCFGYILSWCFLCLNQHLAILQCLVHMWILVWAHRFPPYVFFCTWGLEKPQRIFQTWLLTWLPITMDWRCRGDLQETLLLALHWLHGLQPQWPRGCPSSTSMPGLLEGCSPVPYFWGSLLCHTCLPWFFLYGSFLPRCCLSRIFFPDKHAFKSPFHLCNLTFLSSIYYDWW